jgi:outer membrane protein assembly factor BamD
MKINLLKQLLWVLFITCLCACASGPDTKKPTTDEDYYNQAMIKFKARNYFDAIPAFQELKEKFPLSPYAVLAELRLGDSHYYKEEYVEAIHMYENFRRLHPNNQSVPYSIYMTGMCYYNQILTLDRDPTFARQAAEQFQQLQELFPNSPYTGKALFKLSESRRIVAEHEFFIGEFYLFYKNYPGAISRFNSILKEYPYSIPRDRVIFYIAKANFLSDNKERGQKFLNYLIRKYPESPYAAQAKALLAAPAPKEELQKIDQEAQEKSAENKKKGKKFLFF